MKRFYFSILFFLSSQLLFSISITSTNVFCKGDSSGSATILPSSGAYKYLWTTGDTLAQISNLPIGNYCCYVTTIATNQIDTFCITITEPAAILSLDSVFINKPCGNSCNGQVAVKTASGGTNPYYNLNGTPLSVFTNNICYGNNNLVVKDAKGCLASKSFFVDSFPQNNVSVYITGDSATRCNNPNAVISANVNGGSGNYTYKWSNGATTNAITVTQPALYNVTVLDGVNSCPRQATFRVYNGSSALLNYTSTIPTSCNNISLTGSATIHVQGGLAPITYTWGTTPLQSSQSISGLSAGSYPYTVSDAAGCTGTGTANVYVGNALHTSTYTSPSNCMSNGTATVNTYYNGANAPTAPLTYQWNCIPTQYTKTAVGLSFGNYSVTVTDSSGCTATGIANVDSGFNIITGYLYIDSNTNCIKDNNDSPIKNLTVYASGLSPTAGTYYGRTDSNGYYTIYVPKGQFILKFYNYFKCMNICNQNNDTIDFPGSCATSSGHDVGLVSSSNTFDLELRLQQSFSRPGINKIYNIFYSGFGTQTTGVITMKYDPNIQYTRSSLTPTSVDSVNHLITWNVSRITRWFGFSSFNDRIDVTFYIPATLIDTTQLNTRLDFYPKMGDCDSTNNVINDKNRIRWSFDPNAKVCHEGDKIGIKDSTLNYDIHFQNTGRDSTVFIVIKDTLSPFVDPASVRDISASHPYTFSIDGEGVLTWRFDPLFLPDSATDPVNSQGYINYSVRLKPNLPIGTQIDNRANIYFDYNPPIVTNTATTKIVEYTGIHSIAESKNIVVKVYPNPFSESTTYEIDGINSAIQLEIHNMLGQLLTTKTVTNSNYFVFKTADLPVGIYIYSIKQNGKMFKQGKLVKE